VATHWCKKKKRMPSYVFKKTNKKKNSHKNAKNIKGPAKQAIA